MIKNLFKRQTALLLGMLLVPALVFTSCGDEDENGVAGLIDPNTIATADLVAHWPFDRSAVERIANLSPTTSPGVTYIPARRNQAFQGAANAHLSYALPAGSPLRNLTSFTVSFWLRSPLVTGDPEPTIFEIGSSTDLFWGNLKVHLHRLPATADSLNIRTYFRKHGATWAGQFTGFSHPSFAINRWLYITLTYNETTSKFEMFLNGAKVTTNPGVEDRWQGPADVTPRLPLGPLAFHNPDVINFGAWRPRLATPPATDPWMGWFMGNVDEFRVFDRALTPAEVKSLYDAEVSQITN
ncbi:MAG TPA: LamG-like jellyroll fold domain-containing protein [Bacteroidales bacterium]|nr:LamG-like jellyroll fold domain-containing protein [Bacteroidales bacterium]